MAINNSVLVTLELMDFEGEIATTRFTVAIDDTSTLADIETAVDGLVTPLVTLSNCRLVNRTISYGHFYTKEPPALPGGKWPNVEDKALMAFNDVQGQTVRLSIPAPIDGMMLADQETVDATDVSVAAFITAWTTPTGTGEYVVDESGTQAVHNYNFGYRKRAKSRNERPGRYKASG